MWNDLLHRDALWEKSEVIAPAALEKCCSVAVQGFHLASKQRSTAGESLAALDNALICALQTLDAILVIAPSVVVDEMKARDIQVITVAKRLVGMNQSDEHEKPLFLFGALWLATILDKTASGVAQGGLRLVLRRAAIQATITDESCKLYFTLNSANLLESTAQAVSMVFQICYGPNLYGTGSASVLKEYSDVLYSDFIRVMTQCCLAEIVKGCFPESTAAIECSTWENFFFHATKVLLSTKDAIIAERKEHQRFWKLPEFCHHHLLLELVLGLSSLSAILMTGGHSFIECFAFLLSEKIEDGSFPNVKEVTGKQILDVLLLVSRECVSVPPLKIKNETNGSEEDSGYLSQLIASGNDAAAFTETLRQQAASRLLSAMLIRRVLESTDTIKIVDFELEVFRAFTTKSWLGDEKSSVPHQFRVMIQEAHATVSAGEQADGSLTILSRHTWPTSVTQTFLDVSRGTAQAPFDIPLTTASSQKEAEASFLFEEITRSIFPSLRIAAPASSYERQLSSFMAASGPRKVEWKPGLVTVIAGGPLTGKNMLWLTLPQYVVMWCLAQNGCRPEILISVPALINDCIFFWLKSIVPACNASTDNSPELTTLFWCAVCNLVDQTVLLGISSTQCTVTNSPTCPSFTEVKLNSSILAGSQGPGIVNESGARDLIKKTFSFPKRATPSKKKLASVSNWGSATNSQARRSQKEKKEAAIRREIRIIQVLKNEQLPISCESLALQLGESILDTKSTLTSLAQREYCREESNGWVYVA